LRLLVKVRRGRELEFESRVLGERILNVLFIRLPPRALGTDGDESDGRQIIPATFAALAACPFRIAAATRAKPKGQDAHADHAIEPTGPLCRCQVCPVVRYFGHMGRASRSRALPPALTYIVRGSNVERKSIFAHCYALVAAIAICAGFWGGTG